MKMIGESREDYLKAILIISDGGTISVRPLEIAKQLNVTYPSVTRAVKLLGGMDSLNTMPAEKLC